jgi:hypothetical protein
MVDKKMAAQSSNRRNDKGKLDLSGTITFNNRNGSGILGCFGNNFEEKLSLPLKNN